MSAESHPVKTSLAGRVRSSWRMMVAGIWLVGFFAYFFTRPMPNLHDSLAPTRSEAWQRVPWVILDWVLPEDAPPQAGIAAMPAGWQYLPERFVLWSWAGLILLGAWGIGYLILRWLIPGDELAPLERFVFASGVGLSIVSLLTLFCGLIGFLSRGFFIGVLSAAFLWAFGAAGRSLWKDRSRRTWKFSRGPGLCVFVLLPFLAAMLFGGVSPSTDFDVKEYHFEGPKEFFLAGRVQFLPHNVYTSFPFLTEMLTLLGMVLKHDWADGALVGKSVLMAFVPLTGLAILAAGRRWFGNPAGWLGMLVWLTTPWATRIAIIAYAEGGLTFFLFAAFFATALAIEQITKGRLQPGPFLLAGFLSGSAMASKYTGLVSVVLPLAAAVGFAAIKFYQKESLAPSAFKLGLRTLGVFGLGVAIAIGPWLVKNLIETGNPVYPLAWSIFGGRDWNAELNAQWTKAHSPPDHRLSSLFVLDNGAPGWIIDVSAINDWLSPLLYGLAPLVFLVPTFRRRAGAIWLYAAWLFFAWWCFTHRLDRFWVPMLPVIALLAGAGAAWSSERTWKILLSLAIAGAVLFNFVLIATQNAGYIAWLTKLEAAQNFTARLTAPEIAEINHLAKTSPDKIRVLSVGEAEVFDADFPVIYNTVFDRSIFQEWTAKPNPGAHGAKLSLRSPKEIREKFHREGITHVLVNWQEILRYRPTYGYVEYVEPKRFRDLVEKGVLEPPIILNRQSWKNLTPVEQRELTQSGWRELLQLPSSSEEQIVLSALYRVR